MLRRIATAVFLALLTATAAAAEPSLGDRRGIAAYQSTAYPEQLKAIQAAAGYELPVEVRWPNIALPGEGESYKDPDYWTNIYFAPLTQALKAVGSDEMGRTAMREKLKQVVITYDEATAPASNWPNGVSFENGVLTLNFRPYTNAGEVAGRADAIRKLLEAKL